jgi:hypothetical protein
LLGGDIVRTLAAYLVLLLALFSQNLAYGQIKTPPPAEQAPNASTTISPANDEALESAREQLFKFLRMSPRLTMAISTDPSLLGYPDYVNKYNPELANFIRLHPEIARNPEFYLFANLPRGRGNNVPYLFQRQVWPDLGSNANQNQDGEIIAFFVFLVVLVAILWLFRMLLQNRRWNRVFKVQTEMHLKLLDKLGGNQDLFSYLGSDAGRKFMDLAPIAAALESPRQGGLPGSLSRILAPLQFGIVATLGGVGLLFLRKYLDSTGELLLVGTVALMLGLGLILSAGISWALARRFGLVSGKTDEN